LGYIGPIIRNYCNHCIQTSAIVHFPAIGASSRVIYIYINRVPLTFGWVRTAFAVENYILP
jgi:hypothetical protein